MGEAYTENCAGRREFAAPESWYSFEMPIEIDEGFNVHRSQYRSIRNGSKEAFRVIVAFHRIEDRFSELIVEGRRKAGLRFARR